MTTKKILGFGVFLSSVHMVTAFYFGQYLAENQSDSSPQLGLAPIKRSGF